jgi:DNA replication protein DnaC
VLFATASEWVDRLVTAHRTGTLQAELTKLGRYPLLVIDEVGYIPFEPEAANLFFQLVSARYERASLIVTSNKPFGKAHMFAGTYAGLPPKRCEFEAAAGRRASSTRSAR